MNIRDQGDMFLLCRELEELEAIKEAEEAALAEAEAAAAEAAAEAAAGLINIIKDNCAAHIIMWIV